MSSRSLLSGRGAERGEVEPDLLARGPGAGQCLRRGDVGGRGPGQQRADRLDGRGVGRARVEQGQPQQLEPGPVLLQQRQPGGQVGGGGELQDGRQEVGQLGACELDARRRGSAP